MIYNKKYQRLERDCFMKKKMKKEVIFNKLSLFGVALLGISIGIILILISNNFPRYESTIGMIGQTIITISASSLLLEWFGYVNYTRKRMCEILAEDEVIQVLDMDRKKELKSALIKNIYMYNAPSLQLEENNISTIIDNEMDNILKDYYFDEFIMYIDASIKNINEELHLKKKIRTTCTAKTVNKQNCILDNPISTYLKPPNNNMEAVKLKNFYINGEKLEIENWKIIEEDNTKEMKDTYTKHYSLQNVVDQNKNLFTFKEQISIDYEYETLVNIDDLVYSYQVPKACKHLCIHYNAPSDYKIIMEGFGFMSTGNSQRQRLVKTENGCMIRFLDWILPGNGVMIVLQHK